MSHDAANVKLGFTSADPQTTAAVANAATGLAYEFSLLEEAAEGWPTPNAYTEAIEKIQADHRKMRAALEDIAAARREFTLTGDHDFNYVESFWFLVKLAEGVVGDA